jgi:Zn-dependent M28 family amino/carboxypeptidase
MKKFFSIYLILFINFLASAQQSEISLERIKEATFYLASDELEGRDTGSKGIELAAQYIENKLKSYGIRSFYNTYRDSLKINALDAYNLIGYLPGKIDSLKHHPLILSAHYDHIGFKGKAIDGDQIVNGANDNAASVALVLELAKYFSDKPQNRPILFVLFTAEEIGLRGAKHLAKRFQNEDLSPVALINFEMVGIPMKNYDHLLYMTGYNKSNLAEIINSASNKKTTGFLQMAEQYGLFKASDNWPMYDVLKFPAHSVSSFDFQNYPYYHHVKDEAQLMDYEHLTTIANHFTESIKALCKNNVLLFLKE